MTNETMERLRKDWIDYVRRFYGMKHDIYIDDKTLEECSDYWLKVLSSETERAVREERDRMLNQPANEHDREVMEHYRERIEEGITLEVAGLLGIIQGISDTGQYHSAEMRLEKILALLKGDGNGKKA